MKNSVVTCNKVDRQWFPKCIGGRTCCKLVENGHFSQTHHGKKERAKSSVK